jgi:tRNA C32,U32 (ribose-2'-O)-methylase TrmJ
MFLLQSTHSALIQVKQVQIDHLSDKLEERGYLHKQTLNQLKSAMDSLRVVLDTNKKITSELLLLRGGIGRVRTEQNKTEDVDPLLMPDIVVSDDTSMTNETKEKAVAEAREALEKLLAGFDEAIPEEVVTAATPESEQDWKEEHAEPTTVNNLVASD